MDIAAIITAISVLLTTVLGVFLSLRNEFRKAAIKVAEVHDIMNNRYDVVLEERNIAQLRNLQYEKDIAALKTLVETLQTR